jgi:hypothetical protein
MRNGHFNQIPKKDYLSLEYVGTVRHRLTAFLANYI